MRRGKDTCLWREPEGADESTHLLDEVSEVLQYGKVGFFLQKNG